MFQAPPHQKTFKKKKKKETNKKGGEALAATLGKKKQQSDAMIWWLTNYDILSHTHLCCLGLCLNIKQKMLCQNSSKHMLF